MTELTAKLRAVAGSLAISSTLLILFFYLPVFAVEPAPGGKCAKYLDILRQRPQPGYLFDRFYQAWLEEHSTGELETFLLEKADDDQAFIRLLACYYESEGMREKALTVLNRLLAKDISAAPDILFQRACLHLALNNNGSAERDLKAALAAEQDIRQIREIRKRLGRLLLQQGKRQAGLKVWDKLLADAPDDPELRQELFELQYEEGLFSEAAATAEKLLTQLRDPFRAAVLKLRLAEIKIRQRNPEAAMNLYAECLRQSGSESWLEKEILFRVDQFFRRRNQLNGLEKWYERQNSEIPGRPGIVRRHAELLREMGRQEEALDKFRKLLEQLPENRELREEFVLTLKATGQIAQATNLLRDLRSRYPEDGELAFRQAWLFFDHPASDPAAGEQALRDFLELSGRDLRSYLRAAELAAEKGFVELAVELYDELVTAFPGKPDLRLMQAAHLLKSEREDEAEKIYRALCVEAELPILLKIAAHLTTARKGELAYELMLVHKQRFRNNFAFQTQLLGLASQFGDEEQAREAAIAAVDAAVTVPELKRAVNDAYFVLLRHQELNEKISDLEKLAERSVPQACLLAELLVRRGRGDEAAEVLADAAKRYPENILLGASEFFMLLREGRWERAGMVFRRLRRKSETPPGLYLRDLVTALEQFGETDLALQWTNEWRKLEPNSYFPYIILAQLHLRRGTPAAAEEVLREATRRFPEQKQLVQRLADFYEDQGKLPDAARIYQNLLLETDAQEAKISHVLRLFALAEKQDRGHELINEFRQRAENSPGDIFPVLALAEIYRKIGDNEGRRQALRRAVAMQADNHELQLRLADIEERCGNYLAAQRILSRLWEQYGQDSFRQSLVQFLFRQNEFGQAYKLLSESLRDGGSDPEKIEETATLMINSGRAQEAAELLAGQLELMPGAIRLQYLFGLALAEAGKVEQAVDALIRVCEIRDQLIREGQLQLDRESKIMTDYGVELGAAIAVNINEIIWVHELSREMARQQRSMTSQSSFPGTYPASGGGAQALLSRTVDADDIALHVMAQLARILSREGDNDARFAVAQRLLALGIEYPELKLAVCIREPGHGSFWSMARELYPDDDNVLAMWAHFCCDHLQDEAIIREMFAKFADTRPQIAARVALSAYRRKLADETMLKRIANDILPRISRPDDRVLFGLQSLFTEQGRLSDEIADPLLSGLIRLFKLSRDLPPNPGRTARSAEYLFTEICHACIRQADYSRLVAFIEWEWPDLEKKSGSSLLQQSQTKKRIVGLNFPPRELPGYSSRVLQLLDPAGGQGRYKIGDVDRDAFWRVADRQLEDQLLRFFVMAYCNRKSELMQITGNLQKAEDCTFVELFSAASWLGTQEEYPAALNLLLRAGEYPDSFRLRESFDPAMIFYAEKIALKDEAYEAPAEIVAAANRLFVRALTREQQEELLSYCNNLGISEISEKISTRLTQSHKADSPAAVANDPRNQIRLLENNLQKEITDERIGVAVQIYREIVAAQFSSNTSYIQISNQHWLTEQFRDMIIRTKTEKRFLDKLIIPREKSHLRNRLEIAYALELFERKGEAEKEYRKILGQRPQNPFANLRMAELKLESDPETAFACLENLPVRNSDELGFYYTRKIINARELSERLRYLPIITHLLKRADKLADYSWLSQLLAIMDQPLRHNNMIISTMYEKQDSAGFPPELEALVRQREQLFIKLCDTAIERQLFIPQLLSRKLAIKTLHNDFNDADFAELKELIIAHGDKPWPHVAINSNPHNPLILPRPPFFFVNYAVNRQRQADIEEVLQQLRDKNQFGGLVEIESVVKLHEALAKDFQSVAEDYINESGSKTTDKAYRLQEVIKLVDFQDGQLTGISLDELVLKELESLIKQRQAHRLAYLRFPVQWAEILWKRGDNDALQKYLNSLVSLFDGRDTGNRQNVLSSFFAALSNSEPGMIFPMLDAVAGLHAIDEKFKNDAAALFSQRQITWELLQNSPLLASWEDFNPYCFTEPKFGGLFPALLSQLRNNRDMGKEFIPRLQALGNEFFGAQMMLCLLQAESPEKFFQWLDARPELDFNDKARMRQLAIAAISCVKILRPLGIDTGHIPENNRVYELCLDIRKSLLESNLNDFHQRGFEPNRYSDYLNSAGRLFGELVQLEPDRAGELLDIVFKKLKTAQKHHPGSFRNRMLPIEAEFCRICLDHGNMDLPAVMALSEYIQYSGNIGSGAVKTVFDAYGRALGERITFPDKPSPEIRLRRLATQLNQFGESVLPPPLSWQIFTTLNKLSEDSRRTMLAEFEKIAAPGSGMTEFMHFLRISQKQPGAERELSDWYVRQLQRQELSPAWRLIYYTQITHLLDLYATPSEYGPEIVAVIVENHNLQEMGELDLRFAIRLFALLPPTAEWRKQAEKIIREWQRGHIETGNPGNRFDILEICMKAEAFNAAAEIFHDPRWELFRQPAAVLISTRYGKFDWAEELLRKPVAMETGLATTHGKPPMKSSDVNIVEEFLQKIEDDDLGFYAECVFASLPVCDVKSDGSPELQTLSAQTARQRQLAQEFLERKFVDAKYREKSRKALFSMPGSKSLIPNSTPLGEKAGSDG